MSIRPITHGALGSEIRDIIQAKYMRPDEITYEAILHTVDQDIYLKELVSIEFNRDYVNNITDHIVVTFRISVGVYIKYIDAFRGNLELTIRMHYYDRTYDDRYKLVITNKPTGMTGTALSFYTAEELDKLGMAVIEAQAYSRLVEVMRNTMTSGVYKYTKVKDVIKTVTLNKVKAIKVDGKVVPVRVDVKQPNNDQIYRHVQIPTGITVLDVPSYLQNSEYGVYSTGIGTYVQKYPYFLNPNPEDTVFVYPLYNTSLTDKPGKKLMIYSTPDSNTALSDTSYVVDGDIIKVIGNVDSEYIENKEENVINAGNTITKSNTGSVMEGTAAVTDTHIAVDKHAYLSTAELDVKHDGLSGGSYAANKNNIYVDYTIQAMHRLNTVKVIWKYSNANLLYPAMPVIYTYEDRNGTVYKLNGVLQTVFTKYSASYKTNTALLFIKIESYAEATTTNVTDLR